MGAGATLAQALYLQAEAVVQAKHVDGGVFYDFITNRKRGPRKSGQHGELPPLDTTFFERGPDGGGTASSGGLKSW